MKPYLAIINPAAGGGRCDKQAAQVLQNLRDQGVPIESTRTKGEGHASELSREAYNQGFRRFIAVGGDGTSYEIVNGLFPREKETDPIYLGFLPLGTGNSFLRDFSSKGLEASVKALVNNRSRSCDVIRFTHKNGLLHYINLCSLGFTAEAGALTNQKFKKWREAGYLLAILLSWLNLNYPTFPFRLNQNQTIEYQPCIYLTFSNSRFTGGKLMIAPQANISDGLIEITGAGTISRWNFLKTFPKIFTGKHMDHPLVWRTSASHVEFKMSESISVMIDGEILFCLPKTLDVLPNALQVMV